MMDFVSGKLVLICFVCVQFREDKLLCMDAKVNFLQKQDETIIVVYVVVFRMFSKKIW